MIVFISQKKTKKEFNFQKVSFFCNTKHKTYKSYYPYFLNLIKRNRTKQKQFKGSNLIRLNEKENPDLPGTKQQISHSFKFFLISWQ